MVIMAAVALTLQVVSPVPAAGVRCTDQDMGVLSRLADASRRGGIERARAELDQQADASDGRCADLDLARIALRAWSAARTLGPTGGGDEGEREALRRTLARLTPLMKGPRALDAEYADVAVRAAMAAAQDERPEMELLLSHARDLAERIGARGRRVEWPRPFNLLAGELWLEVDRYEEARTAFERAVRDEPSPMALLGLGQTLNRLDRKREACEAFREARGATHELADRLSGLVAACQ